MRGVGDDDYGVLDVHRSRRRLGGIEEGNDYVTSDVAAAACD